MHKILFNITLPKNWLSLILLLLLSVGISGQGNENPVFYRLTNDDGLSQGTIRTIAQDQKGFIWIGTNDGLNRYDGYEVVIFRNSGNDSTSISSNHISKILVDNNGVLWIGTKNGLNRFDPSIGKFERIRNNILDENTYISDLAIENGDLLWIGTLNSGLVRLNILTREFKLFQNTKDKNSIPPGQIGKLFIDSQNVLWAGFLSGDISYYTSVSDKFTTLDLGLDDEEKSLNVVTSFQEDSKGNLWVSTYGRSMLYMDTHTLNIKQINQYRPHQDDLSYVISDMLYVNDSLIWLGTDMDGLAKYNPQNGRVKYYSEGPNKYQVSYRTVETLFTDRDQNLWIGTNGKGVNVMSPHDENFKTITRSSPEKFALRFSSVRSILEDNDSILWVGGYVGLQKFNLNNLETLEFYQFLAYSLCQDAADPDILWIGSEGGGLAFLNKSTGKITPYPKWNKLKRTNGPDIKTVGVRFFEIQNLDKENLLIGTNLGLHILNKKAYSYKLFMSEPDNPHHVMPGNVNNIFTDRENRIWITSAEGWLALFDPKNETFTVFPEKENNDYYTGSINTMLQDATGRFWLGTNSGLLLLDKDMKIKKVYDTDKGLPNDVVYGILEDTHGKLWLSTNIGVSWFNPETESFTNFDKSDGLPANEFNRAAYYSTAGKRLFFGGVNGVAIIDPNKINLATAPEKTVITGAKVISDKSYVDFTISYTDEIVLEPETRILSLEFSALKYFSYRYRNFAFRLPGETDQWATIENNRTLTLSNLKPGKHFLEVKVAGKNNEVSVPPTKIMVNILPRFYETGLFKVIMIILFSAGLVLFYLFRVNLITKQRNKLEHVVAQRTRELKDTNDALTDSNEAKNKFFSIIAHDLKSPFNSLLGFSDILVRDWNKISEDEKFEFINFIKNTVEDTYQLLINLLEWSRIQKEQIEFNPQKINLYLLVNECYKQLKADAFLKNIRVYIDIESGQEIFADPNMLHTVFRNLISNAIKFTPKNGKVTVSATQDGNQINCCVKDTGIGMTTEASENLFKLQYRNSNAGTEGETGTGLGLVLCSEFIKKHHGTFSVESTPGKGSMFCFSLPGQI